jgi:hypothetical protein
MLNRSTSNQEKRRNDMLQRQRNLRRDLTDHARNLAVVHKEESSMEIHFDVYFDQFVSLMKIEWRKKWNGSRKTENNKERQRRFFRIKTK